MLYYYNYCSLFQSYVNCTLGVHNIGPILICFGTVSAVSSIAIGYIAEHIKRFLFITAGATFNIGLLIVLWLWRPQPVDIPNFYVIAGCLGLCDAIWHTQTYSKFLILLCLCQHIRTRARARTRAHTIWCLFRWVVVCCGCFYGFFFIVVVFPCCCFLIFIIVVWFDRFWVVVVFVVVVVGFFVFCFFVCGVFCWFFVFFCCCCFVFCFFCFFLFFLGGGCCFYYCFGVFIGRC